MVWERHDENDWYASYEKLVRERTVTLANGETWTVQLWEHPKSGTRWFERHKVEQYICSYCHGRGCPDCNDEMWYKAEEDAWKEHNPNWGIPGDWISSQNDSYRE